MNIVLLDAQTLGNDLDLSLFKKYGNLKIYGTTKPSEILDRAAEAEIIILNKVIMTENVMKELKNLKLICITATGYNNIDIKAAEKLGIAVTNVAGYSTESVAQHTFSMLLYILQHMRYYDNYVKGKNWSQSPVFTHIERSWYEISGKRWAILGLGTIGKRVAKIAQSFGAEIVYYSTSGKNDDSEYQRLELDEILRTSDIISIHAPLNERTENLLTFKELSLMKKESIIVNAGRGGIINEKDLARALNEEIIRAAALDVISTEPMADENPLININNSERLFISPHIAWASTEARLICIHGVSLNIESFMDGERRNRIV